MYNTGIDRNAGSDFRVRSRRRLALDRLHAQLQRGSRYDKDLNTHVALNQSHRDRITNEVDTLVARIG